MRIVHVTALIVILVYSHVRSGTPDGRDLIRSDPQQKSTDQTAELLTHEGTDQNAPRFPDLSGPYLGQTPPGITLEIFAPGIVSVDKYGEFVCIFTPDGRECIFDRYGDDEYQSGAVFTTRIENSRWIEPEIHTLFEGFGEVFLPTMSPDGRFWFFT